MKMKKQIWQLDLVIAHNPAWNIQAKYMLMLIYLIKAEVTEKTNGPDSNPGTIGEPCQCSANKLSR